MTESFQKCSKFAVNKLTFKFLRFVFANTPELAAKPQEDPERKAGKCMPPA